MAAHTCWSVLPLMYHQDSRVGSQQSPRYLNLDLNVVGLLAQWAQSSSPFLSCERRLLDFRSSSSHVTRPGAQLQFPSLHQRSSPNQLYFEHCGLVGDSHHQQLLQVLSQLFAHHSHHLPRWPAHSVTPRRSSDSFPRQVTKLLPTGCSEARRASSVLWSLEV